MKRMLQALGLFGVLSVTLVAASWLPASPATEEKIRDVIVPILVLKAGETKEVMLSSSCARYTRGLGLAIHDKKGTYSQNRKLWDQAGLTATLVDTEDKEEPAPLKKLGLKSFRVRVTAKADAAPSCQDLHVRDDTCAGDCHSDLRVVITE